VKDLENHANSFGISASTSTASDEDSPLSDLSDTDSDSESESQSGDDTLQAEFISGVQAAVRKEKGKARQEKNRQRRKIEAAIETHTARTERTATAIAQQAVEAEHQQTLARKKRTNPNKTASGSKAVSPDDEVARQKKAAAQAKRLATLARKKEAAAQAPSAQKRKAEATDETSNKRVRIPSEKQRIMLGITSDEDNKGKSGKKSKSKNSKAT
jgi:hypothetical protein